jgi:hypothetical protein
MTPEDSNIRMRYRSPGGEAELTFNLKLLDDGKILGMGYAAFH